MQKFILGALVALAVLQAALLIQREVRRGEGGPTALAVGEAAETVSGKIAGSGETAVALRDPPGGWTVILAFNSGCIWCDRAAAHWRSWLATPRDYRVLGITRDPVPVGREYVRRHEWDLDFLSVGEDRTARLEQQLVSRTPWVYVFDAAGTLRYEGGGADLAIVDEIVAGE